MAKLTPEACRAARALLKWGVRDLAREAEIGSETVRQIEAGRAFRESTGQKIIETFAAYGVEITNGTGTGAKLLSDRPTPPAKARAKSAAAARKKAKT